MKKEIKIIDTGIKNIKLGKNVKIYNPVNLYGCTLGDNVKIGPFVEIQKKSCIGNGTTISSHTFICSLVNIGKNCFIGHNVVFINVKFSDGKLGGNIKNWKKTKIGNNVKIGSNATILPVKICANTVIGAGSVVTKDIKKSGIYFGNPAKFIKKI